MSDPFVGHVTLFAGTYIPAGYAECNGQTLAISGNEALYSLLGTQFGGNGRTDFALPDYRGRIPVGVGSGPGIDPVTNGQRGGTESVTLQMTQMPAHSHILAGTNQDADSNEPERNMFAEMDTTQPPAPAAYHGSPADLALADGTMSSTGSSQSHTNMMPFSVVRFIIALTGAYPSRS